MKDKNGKKLKLFDFVLVKLKTGDICQGQFIGMGNVKSNNGNAVIFFNNKTDMMLFPSKRIELIEEWEVKF